MAPAFAATFTVTDGSPGATGPGSLRWADQQANNTPGRDLINFAPGLGTVQSIIGLPANPSLLITESVDIVGPGRDQLTLDDEGTPDPGASTICDAGGSAAKYSDYIFSIGQTGVDSSGIEVTLQGFTLTNAHGLYISNGVAPSGGPSVRVVDVRLINSRSLRPVDAQCRDPLIQAHYGRLDLIDSIVADSYASSTRDGVVAISSGTLNVENTVFSNNAGQNVIAQVNVGQSNITGSTVELHASQQLISDHATAQRLSNSLIRSTSRGTCSPMVVVNAGTTHIRNVSLVSAGESACGIPVPSHLLVSGGSVDMANTLLWDVLQDSPGAPASLVQVPGGSLTGTHNFISSPAEASLVSSNAVSGPSGMNALCVLTAVNPEVNCAPVAGSPVVDAGSNAQAVNTFTGQPLSTDLAGRARIQGLAVDIGAYELAQATAGQTPTAVPALGAGGLLALGALLALAMAARQGAAGRRRGRRGSPPRD